MHFFDDIWSIIYWKAIKNNYICTYDIPEDILTNSFGIGKYLNPGSESDNCSCVSEYAIESNKIKNEYLIRVELIIEVFIDSVLDEGLLRDLPVVETITELIKVTKSIIHRNLLKQTLQFIKEFNNGTTDEDKLLKYKEMLDNNNDKAEEELGRVLIILNGTIDLEKIKDACKFV